MSDEKVEEKKTYWDSVRNTGNVFASVKFFAGLGVENAKRSTEDFGLTLRRFPYLRRMAAPSSTAGSLQQKLTISLR